MANLVASYSPGSPRNNFSGWVGGLFTVTAAQQGDGASVTSLGIYSSGGTGNWSVYLLGVPSGYTATSVVASATIDLTGSTSGNWYYQSITPITLAAGRYMLVAAVTSGGGNGNWADDGASNVSLVSGFVPDYSVVGLGSLLSTYFTSQTPSQWVGLDLIFTPVAPTGSGSAGATAGATAVADGGASSSTHNAVATYTPGSLRNDWDGSLGGSFTPTLSGAPVTSLGIYSSGGTGVWTVNLLDLTTSTLIASANVDLTGSSSGSWYYTSITPVTLTDGNRHGLSTPVTSGGANGNWADSGAVTYTASLSAGTAIWNPGGTFPNNDGAASQQYVGLDLVVSFGTTWTSSGSVSAIAAASGRATEGARGTTVATAATNAPAPTVGLAAFASTGAVGSASADATKVDAATVWTASGSAGAAAEASAIGAASLVATPLEARATAGESASVLLVACAAPGAVSAAATATALAQRTLSARASASATAGATADAALLSLFTIWQGSGSVAAMGSIRGNAFTIIPHIPQTINMVNIG